VVGNHSAIFLVFVKHKITISTERLNGL